MLNSNASSSNENCQLLPSLKDVIVSYSSNTNNTQFEQSFKNQLLLDDNREDIVFNDKDHITVQETRLLSNINNNLSNRSIISSKIDQLNETLSLEQSINKFMLEKWNNLLKVTTMIKRKQNVGIYESSDDDDEEEQENTNNTDEANDIELLTEDFIATTDKIQEIYQLKLSNNTNYLKQYALRKYHEFYELKKDDIGFLEYQGNLPFPIKQWTFAAFIYYLRVNEKYSHSTCTWTFFYSFASYIKENNLGDPKSEYGTFIFDLLKGLLRKFGNYTDKVYHV
ncbi:hypothetical protein ABK040_014912 [Willaertia magna]